MSIDTTGFFAALLTTASFVPQVWQSYRTRDVSGISLGMYSMFTVGVALWLAYGVATDATPVIVANAITLALALCILVMKLRDVAARRRRTSAGSSADNTSATTVA